MDCNITNQQPITINNEHRHLFFQMRHILNHTLFPIIMICGVLGNILILCVLLTPRMRVRPSNLILSALAFSDILFLLASAPQNLYSSPVIGLSNSQKAEYKKFRFHFNACSNWFSTASSWIVLTVSVERLIAIWHPLHVRYLWTPRRLTMVLTMIFTLSFLITAHYHFGYSFEKVYRTKRYPIYQHELIDNKVVDTIVGYCNRTEQFSAVSWRLGQWSQYLILVQQCTAIHGSTLILIAVNVALIYKLRQQQEHSCKLANAPKAEIASKVTSNAIEEEQLITKNDIDSGDIQQNHSSTRSTQPNPSNNNACNRSRRERAQSDERKVTLLIVVISCFYTSTHFPSSIVSVDGGRWLHKSVSVVWTLVLLTNLLVVVGKAFNFALFCCASSSFRTQLCDQFGAFCRRSTTANNNNNMPTTMNMKSPGAPPVCENKAKPAARNSLQSNMTATTTPRVNIHAHDNNSVTPLVGTMV